MSIKQKKTTRINSWAANFLSNVLGVIVGIALTFGITALVQRCSDQKQITEMLLLVENEIRSNRDWLEKRADFYQKDKEAYQFFLSTALLDSIPEDTIVKHLTQANYHSDTYMGTERWNVFQNSGMMQKLHNPELISRLAEFYFTLAKIKDMWNEYSTKRQIVWTTLASDSSIVSTDFRKTLCSNNECVTFMRITTGQNNVQNIEQQYPFVDYILYSIENYKNPAKFNIDFKMFEAARKANNN